MVNSTKSNTVQESNTSFFSRKRNGAEDRLLSFSKQPPDRSRADVDTHFSSDTGMSADFTHVRSEQKEYASPQFLAQPKTVAVIRLMSLINARE